VGHHPKTKPKNIQVEERAKIQNKGNEIIAENFPTLCNDIDTHV
jgi:hypothetical protein